MSVRKSTVILRMKYQNIQSEFHIPYNMYKPYRLSTEENTIDICIGRVAKAKLTCIKCDYVSEIHSLFLI